MALTDSDYVINNEHIRISAAAVIFTGIGLFLFWLAWSLLLNNWFGNNNIGSIWAKNNFTAQYWVYIQPDNADSKNYRVKADIERLEGEYKLTKIYWPNGGYESFDDCRFEETDGIYSSYDDCSSDKLVNGGEDYQSYSIRIDQKVRKSINQNT